MVETEDNKDFSAHQMDVLEEVYAEADSQDPVRQRCKFVSFLDSRGREVNFLVIDGKRVYVVKGGEIRPNRKRNLIGPDTLAEIILTDVPLDRRTPDLLLERARNI